MASRAAFGPVPCRRHTGSPPPLACRVHSGRAWTSKARNKARPTKQSSLMEFLASMHLALHGLAVGCCAHRHISSHSYRSRLGALQPSNLEPASSALEAAAQAGTRSKHAAYTACKCRRTLLVVLGSFAIYSGHWGCWAAGRSTAAECIHQSAHCSRFVTRMLA